MFDQVFKSYISQIIEIFVISVLSFKLLYNEYNMYKKKILKY